MKLQKNKIIKKMNKMMWNSKIILQILKQLIIIIIKENIILIITKIWKKIKWKVVLTC